jgi:hypothetical protein
VALDLAALGLRQGRDKVDGARIGVGAVAVAHEPLQVGDLRGRPVPEYHVRLDDLAADLVGGGDHRALGDRGVGGEDRLDVEWADPVTGHDDDIVVPGGEP